MSKARVAASSSAAAVLRRGSVGPDDPQAGGGALDFPSVGDVVEMRDGAKLRLGGTTLTVHHTPGHTPGGTTWTWRACEGRRCANVVYADSLNPISTEGFRFSAGAGRVAGFRRSIETIRRLPCDVLIAAHPAFTGLFEKQAAREARAPGAPDPMLDPSACRVYAEQFQAKLDERLAEERRLAPQ